MVNWGDYMLNLNFKKYKIFAYNYNIRLTNEY